MVHVDGKDANVTRGLSAHIDTLGLMVRSINSDGTQDRRQAGGHAFARNVP